MRYHRANLFTASLLLCSGFNRGFSAPSSSSANSRRSTYAHSIKDLDPVLIQTHEDATSAEIKRFAKAYGKQKGKADRVKKAVETKLEAYLDWRNSLGLDSQKAQELPSDEAVWEYSVRRAYDIEDSPGGASHATDSVEKNSWDANAEKDSEGSCKADHSEEGTQDTRTGRASVDQVIFFHKSEDGEAIRDKRGNRVMHLLPARINPDLAPPMTYANVFAIYLDHNFDRASMEKVTILVDIRAGEGWANTPVLAMMKVLRSIIRVFEFNFPERVEKFVVFPVPRLARGIFNAIKLLFDSNTANKIVLVAGPDGVDAPVPKQDIEPHIDGDIIDQTERARLTYFSAPVSKL